VLSEINFTRVTELPVCTPGVAVIDLSQNQPAHLRVEHEPDIRFIDYFVVGFNGYSNA
jgi:hypothetical protein